MPGLRSANLATLKVEYLEFSEEGVKVWVERSKTDQKGKGKFDYLNRTPLASASLSVFIHRRSPAAAFGLIRLMTEIESYVQRVDERIRSANERYIVEVVPRLKAKAQKQAMGPKDG